MKILKKTLGIFGFKLVDKNLIQNERIINSYSKIDINFFLQSIINFKKNLEIVQIGASDGITDDFLNKYRWISEEEYNSSLERFKFE